MTEGPTPYDLDTDWAEDWSPDHGLVPAVLAASRPISTITAKQDRCWLVAGLKESGLTADDIADRLKCSLRLVRTLLAEDMATVCRAYHAEAETFGEELRLTRHELAVRTRELVDVQAEADRVREQRDRMIDMAMTGEKVQVCARAGHLLDRYTVYVHPATGKRSCRKCRAEAVLRCRSNSDTSAAPAGLGTAVSGAALAPTAHAGGPGDLGPATAPADVAPSAVHPG